MNQPTTDLKNQDFSLKPTFYEVLESSSGSVAGYSAVSQWIACPEKSRLSSLGVRPSNYVGVRPLMDGPDLDALAFGTLCHWLRGLRILFGHDMVREQMELWRTEIPSGSWAKAMLMFETYEQLFPRATEQFLTLGVECEVISDIGFAVGMRGPHLTGTPILRTVRYDTVVQLPDASGGYRKEVFSFECKTMARSGFTSLQAYWGQAMCQTAIWNANPALVAKYGPMRGVLFDCLVKTVNPNVERVGPHYFGLKQQQFALRYLASADNGMVRYGIGDDGKYPQNLNACWGRWRPCEYIDLCHSDDQLNYEYEDGRPYDGK